MTVPPTVHASKEAATVLRLSGADVVPFLQTKLTCDTRRWRIDGGGFGLATDINGKIVFEGHFALDGADVLAVVPEALVADAIAHIEQYVIMEDVTVTRADDADVIALRGNSAGELLGLDDEEEPARAHAVDLGTAARAFRTPGGVPGADRWLVVIDGAEHDSVLDTLRAHDVTLVTTDEVEEDEIVRGIPRIGRDYSAGDTIPLEAGLWAGVSLSKGCYLGQEVLERLFSRGAAARRLVRVEWDGAPASGGTELLLGGATVGAVTSSRAVGERAVGMAWLKRKALGVDGEVRVGVDGPVVRVGDFVGGPDPESP